MQQRPELTVTEKSALGKLMGAYVQGVALAPSDPQRVVFDALCKRGGWVEKTPEGKYKITNYGMNAFYTGKIIKEKKR